MAAGCIGLAGLLYAPVAGLGLLSDDLVVMQRAGVERDLDQGGFFRPLADLTILAGHAVFGSSALAHRLVNILLHGCCAFALYLLVRRMAPKSPTAAWMAALLFLAYPFHGEAVIWIVGRGSAMATLFSLLALLVLVCEAPPWRAALLSAACWALALLAYESALLLPLLALPLLFGRHHAVRAVLLSWGAVLVLYLGLRLGHVGGLVNDYGTTFFRHGPSAYLDSLMHATGRLFLPPGPWHGPWHLLVLAVALLAVVALVRLSLRNDRSPTNALWSFSWMLAIALLVPMLAGVSTETSEGDRFLYMPSAFLCALMGGCLALLPLTSIRMALLVLLLGAQGVFLLQLQSNWRVASHTLDRLVDGMQALRSPAHTWVVHVPEEHEGAFILRHGLREALLLRCVDADGFTHAGRLRRYAMLQAPDTIRPVFTAVGLTLEPGVRIDHTAEGDRLITPFHDVLLAKDDRVLYWDRHQLRVLWPSIQAN